jgi:hypothetical protein
MKDVLKSFVVGCLFLGAVIGTVFLIAKYPLFFALSITLTIGVRICIMFGDVIRSNHNE